MLAIVCLIIIPMPVGTVRQAFSDMLLIAPLDLKRHVDRVAIDTASKHGFLSYRAYVAKVGRAIQVELSKNGTGSVTRSELPSVEKARTAG